jgi:hypothetical protein
MTPILVVVRPFGSYQRGDVISDQAEIEHVLASEHVGDVVRVLREEG